MRHARTPLAYIPPWRKIPCGGICSESSRNTPCYISLGSCPRNSLWGPTHSDSIENNRHGEFPAGSMCGRAIRRRGLGAARSLGVLGRGRTPHAGPGGIHGTRQIW
jgi:hypothetical protein